MISDFDQLSDKIRQLAEMVHSLRMENAALRHHALSIATENARLQQRIDEAHQRVSTLLERIPGPEQDDDEEAV